MIDRRGLALGLTCLVLVVAPAAAQATVDPFLGVWGGVLNDGERQRLELVIGPGRKATLINLDNGGEILRPTALRTLDEAIHIEFHQLSGVFDGRLVGADRIDGVWRQAGRLTPISLRRQAGSSVPYSSRTPPALRRR